MGRCGKPRGRSPEADRLGGLNRVHRHGIPQGLSLKCSRREGGEARRGRVTRGRGSAHRLQGPAHRKREVYRQIHPYLPNCDLPVERGPSSNPLLCRGPHDQARLEPVNGVCVRSVRDSLVALPTSPQAQHQSKWPDLNRNRWPVLSESAADHAAWSLSLRRAGDLHRSGRALRSTSRDHRLHW